jgi:hypothetical protein
VAGRNSLNEILCLETSKSFQRDACHSYIQLRVGVRESVAYVRVRRELVQGVRKSLCVTFDNSNQKYD